MHKFKLDDREVRAVAVLRTDPAFATLVEALKNLCDKTDTALANLGEEYLVRQSQGRAQLLRELISELERSPN